MSLVAGTETAASPGTQARRGITRRQALAAAAVTGLGIGAVRLLGGSMQSLARPKPGSGADWVSPLGSESARVMQLLRRASFGYTPTQLESALSDGFNKTVDRLIETPPAEPPALDVASTPGGRFAVGQLQQWWLDHMLSTSTPMAERMTLFWHGHFTSDYRKTADNTFMYWQNLTWRRMAMTNLRPMLMEVTTDPAMLRYLDLATSTGQNPNENYSRELMELFTMGPGNYSETDVREGARALSGLRILLFDASGTRMTSPRYSKSNPQAYLDQINTLVSSGATFRGVVVPRVHDSSTKTFLGHTGNLGPDDVIDIVLAQPSCAPFVTRRAMTFFANPNPSAADVNLVATQFRSSRYDLRTLMRAIFRSSAFTAPSNYRSLMRSPTDYVVAAMRTLNRPALASIAVRSAAGMDQVLYDPPNVAGWPTNSGWISSSSLLSRINFATVATARAVTLPDVTAAVRTQLDSVLGKDTATALSAAKTPADRWFALLASPEFHLK